MNRRGKACFLFLILTIILTFTSVSLVKSAVSFEVNLEDGDIIWYSSAISARTGTRWQPKGYFISLEPSDAKDVGYPLRKKSPIITLYTNNETVKTKKINSFGGFSEVKNSISGKYIRDQIMSNKAFYSKLIKKYKNGDKKLYIDTFFETYELINDAYTKKRVIDAFRKKNKADFEKPNGKYVYVDGSKYEYDSERNEVKKIRKNDLTDIDKIKGAEGWSEDAKKQWLSDKYYNYAINYEIYSNVLVKYVDRKGKPLWDEELTDKNNASDSKMLNISSKKLSNPHYAYYRDDKDKGLTQSEEKKYFGDEVTIRLPREIVVTRNKKKVKYKLISSEYREASTPNEPENIKIGNEASSQKVVLGNEKSLVVGIYEGPPPSIFEKEEEISGEVGTPEPKGVIGSGTIDNSPFDIEKGIPVSEYYFKNVVTENYLLKYRFKRKTGEKLIDVRSYINWHLHWTTGKGKKRKRHSKVERVDYLTTVQRKYSYWYIDSLLVYTLDGAVLVNAAIPDTGSMMMPKEQVAPRVEYITGLSFEEHVKPPLESLTSVNLGDKSAKGRTIPPYNPSSAVESHIGDLMVKNDRLVIDDEPIMDDKEVRKSAPKPVKPATKGKNISDKVLYEDGKTIDTQVQNGIYESSGQVFYTLSDSVNPEGETSLVFDIDDVNPVKVHTPVVCDYSIEDARKWCQLIKPDKSLYQLVLEKDFGIDIKTVGNHLDIKGYGERDYSKYTLKKEVVFPFEVEVDGKTYFANEPITVSGNTVFHLPMTVNEGKYTVIVRAYALNHISNSDAEEYANLSYKNYIAENKINVEVSGRLIDFTLLDVKNTSMWEGRNKQFVFGKGVRLYNLPLIKGDNPKFTNEGAFKKGYAVSFEMTTIGNYIGEAYGIRMDFDFYVIDTKAGSRIPVDIYYEEVSGKDNKKLGLIKVGGKRDNSNIHFTKVGDRDIGLYRYDKALLPKQLLAAGSNMYLQRWRGEYSLPERIYVCKKGFNLEGYMKKHSFIYFDEDFWIKSGYLTVLADISTLKDGKKVLSYINSDNEKDGFFNNWRYETFGRRKKDINGDEIKFLHGDLFVFDLSKKIWQERRTKVKKVY